MCSGISILHWFHWTPPRGGHRRLPICVQECWGTAMHWRLASAGLHWWRHMALARNTVVPKEPRKRRTFSKNQSKIEPRGVQNRALGPPKSSPERSKTRFLKTSNLKSFRGGVLFTKQPLLNPTWLHLGGPRSSKNEAETRKYRRWKTMRFWHRFWKGSGSVLEGFLEGFVKENLSKSAKTRFWRKP